MVPWTVGILGPGAQATTGVFSVQITRPKIHLERKVSRGRYTDPHETLLAALYHHNNQPLPVTGLRQPAQPTSKLRRHTAERPARLTVNSVLREIGIRVTNLIAFRASTQFHRVGVGVP